METKLDYLVDTYLFEGFSKVVEVGNDERGPYLVLENTIFYPQGGGQESDNGRIEWVAEGGTRTVNVWTVRFAEGQVRHYYKGAPPPKNQNQDVSLYVEGDNRIINARLHTAGHLIAAVMEKMDIGVKAIRGYHFKEGPYVAFRGKLPEETGMDDFKENLESQLQVHIQNGLAVSERMTNFNELKELLSDVPSYLPKDKPLRISTIDGFEPIPCGGTHVKNLGELIKVRIEVLKYRKGELRAKYALADI